jgi:4-amino-4-deoxy-L-arabinose transferase-like glycosyltransferase
MKEKLASPVHTVSAPAAREKLWPWLLATAVAGVVLILLYPDGYQQDAGYHFLFARYAPGHPELFVGVWNRPLFTMIYALPAAFGYTAAKLTTVGICLVIAWQTARLARDLGVVRDTLVVPILLLQPSFLILSSETMTEPLFALVFVIALRLHAAGRVKAGMAVASLLILARPEGFLLGMLWGIWVLVDKRDARPWRRRIPGTMILALGFVLWWIAAYTITGDPLFILHNWPPEWNLRSQIYGTGPAWIYPARLAEATGPVFFFIFLNGLRISLRRREHWCLASAFLALFVVHSILRAFSLLGSAGYPRYLVCVSPAIAILTLAGWNALLHVLHSMRTSLRAVVYVAVWGVSIASAVLYVDLATFKGRDAVAVSEMKTWFEAQPLRPVSGLVWSQAFMAIVFDRAPYETPAFSGDRDKNIEMLTALPPGTLVFWDADTGPSWHGVGANDFEAAGCTLLRSETFALDGWLREHRWLPFAPLRIQKFHLLYKAE